MKWLLVSLGLLLSYPSAAETTEDRSFPDDDLESRLAELSEGELILLTSPPDRPVHHHHNRIQITQESLGHGWVDMEQCHTRLDPVSETQIVYHPERIRNIQILSSAHIEQIRIDGPSVQLSGIDREARLCLSAESRALVSLGEGRYRLRNGPFMRRFLDGYYPMRVTQEISYPVNLLKLRDFRPLPGRAGAVRQTAGRILWDAWLKGRLYTEFDFQLMQH
ncbi:MAG: hypothetical protein ABFR65_09725 [Pseudomonadota bacterium]